MRIAPVNWICCVIFWGLCYNLIRIRPRFLVIDRWYPCRYPRGVDVVSLLFTGFLGAEKLSSPIFRIENKKTQTSNRLGLFCFQCRGVPWTQGSRSASLRYGPRKTEVHWTSCASPQSGFVGRFDGKKVRWTFFLIRLTPSSADTRDLLVWLWGFTDYFYKY